MSEIIHTTPIALPAPTTPMNVRVGTRDDMAFMDQLQKMHSKALGFFPRAQMEGYIDGGHVLIAADAVTGEKLGYVASKDRYLKRDELGAVFQLCVVPGKQRGWIGANLLKEVFERSSYGCRLYCCWCAQDLPANHFWQSMGFVPIAYRAGSAKKSRVHIFWQKRIRARDTSTPYWFPAKTEGGAIREDRIILPIPPGMRWTDELPVLETGSPVAERAPARRARPSPAIKPRPEPRGNLWFGPPGWEPRVCTTTPEPATTTLPAETEKRPKLRASPELIARARELRDRYLESVNAPGVPNGTPKYEVAKALPATPSKCVAWIAA